VLLLLLLFEYDISGYTDAGLMIFAERFVHPRDESLWCSDVLVCVVFLKRIKSPSRVTHWRASSGNHHVVANDDHTAAASKTSPYLRHIHVLTGFQNIFTGTFCGSFVIKDGY